MKTTISKGISLGALALTIATTLGTSVIPSAQAQTQRKSFVRRHPFVTAGAVGAGALMYRHHQKKKARRMMRMQQRPMGAR